MDLKFAVSAIYSAMAIITFGTSLIMAAIAATVSILNLTHSILRAVMISKAKESFHKFLKASQINDKVLSISKILSIENLEQCKNWRSALNDSTIAISYKEEIASKVFTFKNEIWDNGDIDLENIDSLKEWFNATRDLFNNNTVLPGDELNSQFAYSNFDWSYIDENQKDKLSENVVEFQTLAGLLLCELNDNFMNVIYSGGNIRGQTMDMIASILNDVYNIRKIVKEFMKILKGGQPTKLEMAIGAYERKAFASQKWAQELDKKIEQCKNLDVATKSANKAAITIVGIIALVLDLLDLALSIWIEINNSKIQF